MSSAQFSTPGRTYLPTSSAAQPNSTAASRVPLGVSRSGLLSARVQGYFKTHHVRGLGGYWGRPRPLLYTVRKLDPSARHFLTPDPLWSRSAIDLAQRLPDDHAPQFLTRIPHIVGVGPSYQDTSHLHPEHPARDKVTLSRSKGRPPLVLPPPEPDYVWYKWKGDQYIGYDWRNPRAEANYLRSENRKAKARAAAQKRRREHPPPSKSQGSLQFRGWLWLCPKCGKKVRVLYLPAPRVNLLTDVESDGVGCDGVRARIADRTPSLQTPSPPTSFACAKCHRIHHVSLASTTGWNEIITYLTGGLLYGHEVKRPEWFSLKRKTPYYPKPNREPSKRRQQIEQLMLKGLPIQRVAQTLSLSKGTVLFYTTQIYRNHGVRCLRELLQKHGIPLPNRNIRGPAKGKRGDGRASRKKNPPHVPKRQQIRQRLLAGEPIDQIAAALNLSRKNVLSHLSRLRLSGQLGPDSRLRARLLTPGLRQEIKQRIARGDRMLQIARELGIGTSTVYWVRDESRRKLEART
jgi:DNA-binding NarL/FixJ family response regulator